MRRDFVKSKLEQDLKKDANEINQIFQEINMQRNIYDQSAQKFTTTGVTISHQ